MFFYLFIVFMLLFFLTADLDSSFSFQLSVWTEDDLCVSTRLTRHHQPIAESIRNFLFFSTAASFNKH